VKIRIYPLAAAVALGLPHLAATESNPQTAGATGFETAGTSPAATEVASSTGNTDELRPGDRLRFQVVEGDDPPSELLVNAAGLIDIPYLGPALVAGRSIANVAGAIKRELEKGYFVTATVRLLLIERPGKSSVRGRVYLSGQVRRIGAFEIDRADANTVGKIILAAGGLTDFADAKKIKIVRVSPTNGEPTTQIVDLREVIERGRIDKDVPIYDGDFVIVDARLVNW
jgi:protein involved in polysaccharide export with SLBB domain